jgi:hypothetical protein
MDCVHPAETKTTSNKAEEKKKRREEGKKQRKNQNEKGRELILPHLNWCSVVDIFRAEMPCEFVTPL